MMDPYAARDRLWMILASPYRFFSKLKEESVLPPLEWYAAGMFLSLFVGGPLSILLSAFAGVPIDKMVGFITGSAPGAYAAVAYSLYLFLFFCASIVGALALAAASYLLSHVLGAKSSYIKSMGMMAYCGTPWFLASAIPQFLLLDTMTVGPALNVIAMAWNNMVDFTQIAALAWSAYLGWVGCRMYYRMSALRTLFFFLVPAIVLLLIFGGFAVIVALLIPAGA